MASGMGWTFLRPTMMMVNTIEWWAATIKSHGTVYFPGGKGKVARSHRRRGSRGRRRAHGRAAPQR